MPPQTGPNKQAPLFYFSPRTKAPTSGQRLPAPYATGFPKQGIGIMVVFYGSWMSKHSSFQQGVYAQRHQNQNGRRPLVMMPCIVNMDMTMLHTGGQNSRPCCRKNPRVQTSRQIRAGHLMKKFGKMWMTVMENK